jgi:hypothetical protein
MATKPMARLVFDSDSDPDLAAEELRKAGYTDRVIEANVRYWHKADISRLSSNVRFRG